MILTMTVIASIKKTNITTILEFTGHENNSARTGRNTVTAAYKKGYRAASERLTTELKRTPLALQGLQQLRYSATTLMIFIIAYQLINFSFMLS